MPKNLVNNLLIHCSVWFIPSIFRKSFVVEYKKSPSLWKWFPFFPLFSACVPCIFNILFLFLWSQLVTGITVLCVSSEGCRVTVHVWSFVTDGRLGCRSLVSTYPKGLKTQLIYLTISWDGWIFRTTSYELSLHSRNTINLKIHPKDC